METILKNGSVYFQGDFIKRDILIKDNFIAEISPTIIPKGNERIIDCTGKHVLPGLIDAHVHFREPGATHKEDYLSGSKAAVAGGVTTVLDMPNTNPPTTTPQTLQEKRSFANKCLTNYGIYVLGYKENTNGLSSFTNIPGVKVFLGSSTGNYLTDNLGTLVKIMKSTDKLIIVHAENEQLINYFSEENKAEQLHHKIRDNLCAVTSMAEAITISSYLNKKLHLAHVSTKEEIDFLRRNKTEKVTCEVCPHHLFLTEEFFRKKGSFGKMNPPLRYQEDREALWQGIREGIIDIVATDHAPHTKEEKTGDYSEVPSGVPGVQTMLPLLLNAVNQKRILLKEVVRLCTANPAKIFSIVKRGKLEVGYHADICVVDLNLEKKIKDEDQFSQCGWTPYDGTKIKGWPIMTIVSGNLVYDHGTVNEHHKGQEVCFKDSLLDLSTTVAGVKLANPIFNASGPRCTTKEELDAIGESASAAVLTKSSTLKSREGNPEPRYHHFSGNSINSMGLPNLGYQEYLKIIPMLKRHDKPIVASISGLSLADNLKMIAEKSNLLEVDLIELNLSCPNVIGKPQMGYDFEQTREVLNEVAKVCQKPLGVKLPPYFDFVHLEEMARILNESSIQFVTCINSLGNGLIIDPETEKVVIKPKGGFGGIGGKTVKPFGLSNVRKFRELLRPDISIIGVGGISTGLDMFEYILTGADAVQVATVLQEEGPEVFNRILQEFKEFLFQKGYKSLAEFKGKLGVL